MPLGAPSASGAAVLGGIVAGASWPPPAAMALSAGYAPGRRYAAYKRTDYQPAPVAARVYWRAPVYDQWGNQMGWSRPKFFLPVRCAEFEFEAGGPQARRIRFFTGRIFEDQVRDPHVFRSGPSASNRARAVGPFDLPQARA